MSFKSSKNISDFIREDLTPAQESALRTLLDAMGKSGAETVAGAKTLTGQLELTGQSADTDDSAMTRELIPQLGQHVDSWRIIQFAGRGEDTVISGSGGMSSGPNVDASSPQGGGTAGGYALQRHGQYLVVNGGGASRHSRNWDRPTSMTIQSMSVIVGTLGEARWMWPVESTHTTGAMTEPGIGFKQVGDQMYGIAHDGTTENTTASSATVSHNHKMRLYAFSDGAGIVEFFVNGTSIGTVTGPTGLYSGYSFAKAINVAEAKETGAFNIYAFVFDWEIKSW